VDVPRPVVLLTYKSWYPDRWLDERWPRLVARADLPMTDARSGPEWDALVARSDVIVSRTWTIDRATLEAGPRLRAVVSTGVGVDRIDVEAASELGIVVANAPGNDISMAEATLLLALAVTKKLPRLMDAAKAGRRRPIDTHAVDLHGKTLGIVGLGRIGTRVARLARAFGMDVLATSVHVRESELAELVLLDDLLRRSDVVSLHGILTPETRHLIGARELGLMKPSAILVNTARGELVDEAALVLALREGRLAGAGLDVLEVEPPDPANPLLGLANVIVTPHGLGLTDEAFDRCAVLTEEAVLSVLDGQLPATTVNRSVRWRVPRPT